MTHDQITFIFETIFSMRPRAADLAVLSVMGTDPDTVADYIWDHMLASPTVRPATRCSPVFKP